MTAPTATSDSGNVVKDVVTLIDSHGGRVDWSAQNIIAFSKFGQASFNAEIWTMKPDGSDQVCLTCNKPQIPHLSNDQPAWTPDGKYVLFQSVDPTLFNQMKRPEAQKEHVAQGGAGVANNLWVTTADGSKFYQLTHIGPGEASLHPHFSHDGKQLLWAAGVRDSAGAGGAHWALDIADFVDDASGPHLTTIRELTPLGTAVFYESHDWSPDDQYVIFSSNANPTPDKLPPCVCAMSIWKLELATGQVTELTNSTNVWNEHAHITRDGKKIAWQSSMGYPFTPDANWQATGRTDMWLMNPDGSNKQQITFYNKAGSSEYNGDRVGLADGDWNPTGDKYVALLDDIKGSSVTSRIVVIEFNHPL